MIRLDHTIWVSGQIGPKDVDDVAAHGIRLIVNNRPDGEVPGQPAGAEIAAAAEASGLGYRAIPVGHDGFGAGQVAAMAAALGDAGGPVLAFCRSGTRSTFLWALAEKSRGADGAGLMARAAAGGYDLSPIARLLLA